MTNIYPIFVREFRTATQETPRRRRLFFAALYAALLLAGLLLAERLTGCVLLKSSAARLFAWPLTGIIPILVLVGGLNRAGQVLGAERREGTLPLLLLTRLSGFDIVVGKTLQTIVLQVSGLLALVPALVLPLAAIGCTWGEMWRAAVGLLNTMFFGLALGFLASVVARGANEGGWRFLLVLPFLANSMPVSLITPTRVRLGLRSLDWINPCEVLGHVQAAAAGLRPSAFWGPLLGSHALAWAFLVLSGWLLSRMTTWRGSMEALPVASKAARRTLVAGTVTSFASRERLLSSNPYLWLVSRDQWAGTKVWLLLSGSALFWVWATWGLWTRSGFNLAYIMAAANGASWFFTLLVAIPVDAGRQFANDRLSCALEMVACTPLGLRGMVAGQWLALRRRYLAPVSVVMIVSAAVMTAGYVTFGFGGMLEPAERPLWLLWWTGGIVLLPVAAIALSWIAMNWAVFGAKPDQAGALAFIYGAFSPAIVLGFLFSSSWAGIDTASLFFVAYATVSGAAAWHARARLMSEWIPGTQGSAALLTRLRSRRRSRVSLIGGWP